MRNAALVAHADESVLQRVTEALENAGYRVAPHRAPHLASLAIAAERFDVVLVSDTMALEGRSMWRHVVEDRPDLPVIALGRVEASWMLEMFRAGLADVVRRPTDERALLEAVARVRGRPRAGPIRRLPTAHGSAFEEVVGSSDVMRRLRDRLREVAANDSPLLLVGETGTGKELVAKSVWQHGPRSKGPFVVINCAAIPAGLIESELFGHAKGAFTGAVSTKFGLFESAHGGTILLDELQSLPLELQPKLLKVLEDKTVRPLGSRREARFDARLICAAGRDLRVEVAEGRFRSDLLYRVDVLRVNLPPLRDRGADVLELAEMFVKISSAKLERPIGGIAPAAVEALLAYSWPGNVRELRHTIAAAVATSPHERIELSDLPFEISLTRATRHRGSQRLLTLESIRREHCEHVLRAVEGNKTEAAKILGVSRQTLYRLMSS